MSPYYLSAERSFRLLSTVTTAAILWRYLVIRVHRFLEIGPLVEGRDSSGHKLRRVSCSRLDTDPSTVTGSGQRRVRGVVESPCIFHSILYFLKSSIPFSHVQTSSELSAHQARVKSSLSSDTLNSGNEISTVVIILHREISHEWQI